MALLALEKNEEVLDKNKIGLTYTEAIGIFKEYGKNNDGYWDGTKLHQQVVNKTLPIAKALYPGY